MRPGFPQPTLRPLHHRDRSGFALVLALLLVSFLVVLLLALTTLVRVETTAAGDQLAQARARAEARFALAVAIGELQRHAGPDTRATATAGLLDTNPASPAPDGVAHPYWTGVWRTTAPTTTAQRVANPQAIERTSPPAWLVSGQEGLSPGASGTFEPRSGPPSDVTLVPLVRAAVEPEGFDPDRDAASRPALHVSAPRVASSLADPAGGEGAHAWWVGDEGVKAAFTAVEPSDGSRFLLPAVDRLSIPARTGLGGLPGWESHRADDPALAARLARVEARGEARLALPGVDARAREDFHDVGFGARSVLADPRLGGLKIDLSTAFSQDEAAWRTGPLAAGAANGESVPGLTPGSTVRVGYLFAETISGARRFRGPTWDLLRSWHNLWREVSTLGGVPRLPARAHAPNSRELGGYERNTTHLFNHTYVTGDPALDATVTKSGRNTVVPRLLEPAVSPFLSEVRLVFGLRAVPAGADPVSGKERMRMELVFSPLVVLHNPTNTWLEVPRSRLAFRGIPVKFQFEQPTTNQDGTPGPPRQWTVDVEDLARSVSSSTNWTDFLRFYLPASSLPPGSFTVFSVPGPTRDFDPRIEAREGKFDDGGFIFPRLLLDTTLLQGNSAAARANAMQPWLVEADVTIRVAASPGAVDNVPPLPNEPPRADYSLWIQHLVPRPGEDVDAGVDAIAQLQEVEVNLFPTQTTGSVSASQLNAYQNFGNPSATRSFRAGGLDVSLGGAPSPLLSVGVVAKSALHDVAKATRPFLSGSPFAPSSRRFPVPGGGFVGILYPWQPEVSAPGSWFSVLEHSGSRGFWGGRSNLQGDVVVQAVPLAPMVSLGQFQHVPIALHGAQPALAIGASFDHPFVARNVVLQTSMSPVQADLSYLANEALFDHVFLSTLAARRGSDLPGLVEAFLEGGLLRNPRMRIAPELGLSREALRDLLLDPRTVAAALLVEGGFNVNSTSVDAWTAVLGAARGLAVEAVTTSGGTVSLGSEDGEGPHRFSRFPRPLGVERGSGPGDARAWTGLVTLDDAEVRRLAEAIVAEMKRRGGGLPYGTLGAFVNRRLSRDAEGSRGLLQAAIDAAGINDRFALPAVSVSTQGNATFGDFRERTNGLGPAGEGAAGSLLQGDLLQALAPFLVTRSDTFVVRTYGEVRNPVTDEVEGRAWIEALVQRLPEPVRRGSDDPGDVERYHDPDVAAPVDFGRRFKVVRFRWLAPDEV